MPSAHLPATWRSRARALATRLPGASPWLWNGGTLLLLAVLIVAIYLPYALRGGWYLDDWDFYAAMKDAADQSFAGLVRACNSKISGGRTAACVYHATVYDALGAHRTLYHLVAMAFLWAMAALTYTVLRLARMPRAWASLAAIALVLYPASDATRMWPVAAVGQYVMVLYLGGLALGLLALKASRLRNALVLHGASLLLTVIAVATYEIAIPLVALNGLVYLVAVWRPRSLARGAIDAAIAVGFGLTRLNSSSTDGVFVIHRTTDQSIMRARLLLRRTWDVWHDVFAPGIGGLLAVGGILLAAAIVARLAPSVRRWIATWAAVFVVALGFVGATAIGYVSANDTYVPDAFSTYNRMNLGGSVAACVAFVALLALVIQIGRGLRLPRIAYVATSVAVIALALHMLSLSTTHKRSWEESWRAQEFALKGYRVALQDVPSNAAIIGFDTPQWESGWVPVFEASWDLRGAITYTTKNKPPLARPAQEVMSCSPEGVAYGDELFSPYTSAEAPLWFVSPKRREAVRISSQARCQRVFTRWGPAPHWGRTLSDPQAVEQGTPIPTDEASTRTG